FTQVINNAVADSHRLDRRCDAICNHFQVLRCARISKVGSDQQQDEHHEQPGHQIAIAQPVLLLMCFLRRLIEIAAAPPKRVPIHAVSPPSTGARGSTDWKPLVSPFPIFSNSWSIETGTALTRFAS